MRIKNIKQKAYQEVELNYSLYKSWRDEGDRERASRAYQRAFQSFVSYAHIDLMKYEDWRRITTE